MTSLSFVMSVETSTHEALCREVNVVITNNKFHRAINVQVLSPTSTKFIAFITFRHLSETR